MKKFSFILTLAFILMIFSSSDLFAAKIKVMWDNATTYGNGEIISESARAKLKTTVEIKKPGTSNWSELITVTDGANSWNGDLPIGYDYDDLVDLRAKAMIVGINTSTDWSPYCDTVSGPIPFPPLGVGIIKSIIIKTPIINQ